MWPAEENQCHLQTAFWIHFSRHLCWETTVEKGLSHIFGAIPEKKIQRMEIGTHLVFSSGWLREGEMKLDSVRVEWKQGREWGKEGEKETVVMFNKSKESCGIFREWTKAEGGGMIWGGCIGCGLPWQLLLDPKCYVLPRSAGFCQMTKSVPFVLRYPHNWNDRDFPQGHCGQRDSCVPLQETPHRSCTRVACGKTKHVPSKMTLWHICLVTK